MKRTAIVLALLAGCATSPDATGGDSGGGSGKSDSDTSGGGKSVAGPQALVPSALGRVNDFAVAGDTFYPILDTAGAFELVACPGFVCGATPKRIGEVSSATQGRGVTVAGTHIFWIGPNDPTTNAAQLMAADLDGASPHVVQTFPDAQLLPPLRTLDASVYLNVSPLTAAANVEALAAYTIKIDAAGTITNQPWLSASYPSTADDLDIDTDDGFVAVHHNAIAAGTKTAMTLYDVAADSAVSVGNTATASSLAVTLNATFYIRTETTRSVLYGNANQYSDIEQKVAVVTGFAIAADSSRLYFPTTTGTTHSIVACDVSVAMTGGCTPTDIAHPAHPNDLSNVRVMRVVDGYLYVGDDGIGSASAWRIKL